MRASERQERKKEIREKNSDRGPYPWKSAGYGLALPLAEKIQGPAWIRKLAATQYCVSQEAARLPGCWAAQAGRARQRDMLAHVEKLRYSAQTTSARQQRKQTSTARRPAEAKLESPQHPGLASIGTSTENTPSTWIILACSRCERTQSQAPIRCLPAGRLLQGTKHAPSTGSLSIFCATPRSGMWTRSSNNLMADSRIHSTAKLEVFSSSPIASWWRCAR